VKLLDFNLGSTQIVKTFEIGLFAEIIILIQALFVPIKPSLALIAYF